MRSCIVTLIFNARTHSIILGLVFYRTTGEFLHIFYDEMTVLCMLPWLQNGSSGVTTYDDVGLDHGSLVDTRYDEECQRSRQRSLKTWGGKQLSRV